MKILITGATGFLGGWIADKLVSRGRDEVRALARPSSDTRRLKKLGVEIAPGDITDPASLARAMEGVEGVYHAAAKVGDWGPREEFEAMTVEGTRNVLRAAEQAGAARFLHVSSVAVYGLHCNQSRMPKHGPVKESDPLAQHLWSDDWYSRTKIEAEKLALGFHAERRLDVRVIRPAWIYGPGDRASLPRLVRFLRKNGGLIIGKGDNRLSLTYGPNVADAALLAMESPEAGGECFNVANDGEITQAEYMAKCCAILGLAAPCKRAPYGAAYAAGAALERAAKLLRRAEPPTLTRFAVTLIANDNRFSHDKAEKVLGWTPKVLYDEGITAALDWYFCKESGACA